MKVTDRPGRYFAIFIFSPTLLTCGVLSVNCNVYISYILIFQSILLFTYEIYWISFKPPEVGYNINL